MQKGLLYTLRFYKPKPKEDLLVDMYYYICNYINYDVIIYAFTNARWMSPITNPTPPNTTQSIPMPCIGTCVAKNCPTLPRSTLAVSKPDTRAVINVAPTVHAYTHWRPLNNGCTKANKINAMDNGYKNINTGMAAVMMVFNPNIPTPKEINTNSTA